jgi:hypothetical protein
MLPTDPLFAFLLGGLIGSVATSITWGIGTRNWKRPSGKKKTWLTYVSSDGMTRCRKCHETWFHGHACSKKVS